MKKLYLAIALILSGVLSSYAPYLLAGLIFGVVLGIYIKSIEKIDLTKIVFWILMSWFAYGVAFYTTFFLYTTNPFIGFIVGGLVGSAILAFSTTKEIKKLDMMQILIIIIVGGISSLAFILSLLLKIPYYILGFVIWQLAVGMTLATLLNLQIKITMP